MNKEVGVMDKREVLVKTKLELREFQHLLERYKDPLRAYFAWKEGAQFDISWMLDSWIFDERLGVDEVKKRVDYWCKLIDEDLMWLERYPTLEEWFSELMKREEVGV